MYKQTDERLNPIGAWGCFYISILAIIEDATGRVFTPKDILVIWAENLNDGDLTEESFIMNPDRLARELTNGKIGQVGKFPATYQLKEGEYEILEWHNPRTKFTHFTTGDGTGKCKFDPLGSSVTVREGKVMSKRIFKVFK